MSMAMNFQLIIELLRARAVFILLVVGVTVVSGPFEQMGVPSQLAGSYMATQVDIISNQNVALKVVDALGLGEDPLAAEAFMQRHKANPDWSSEGVPNLREVIALLLEEGEPELEAEFVGIHEVTVD